jgi:peptidyl-tRNA hydrolase
MSTTRFETTLHALKQGAKSFTIEKATSNIEGWEEYLSKHEHAGVKKVVTDLGKLKKLLHAPQLDGEAIKSLLHTLGKDTVAVAGHEETATAKHIKELGEALSNAA